MFSQVSVILFKGMGIPDTRFLLRVGMPGTRSLLCGRHTWSQLTSRRVGMSKGWYVQGMVGMYRGYVCLWVGISRRGGYSRGTPTPSGSHHTHGHQAGGTHPTGMLSCFLCTDTTHLLQNVSVCSTKMLSPNMRSMHFKDTNLDVLRVTEYTRENTSGNWLHVGTYKTIRYEPIMRK